MPGKGKIIYPAAEQDAAITAAALSDPDAQPLTDGDFARMKPVRGRGRPLASGSKIQMTMRFDADVIETFKATGEGWQTKMNDALKDSLKTHQVR